jgi:hypothetical protein
MYCSVALTGLRSSDADAMAAAALPLLHQHQHQHQQQQQQQHQQDYRQQAQQQLLHQQQLQGMGVHPAWPYAAADEQQQLASRHNQPMQRMQGFDIHK